ncbi:hypothetical protein VCHA37P202_30033 [Vibrio chagasii]|nr:hypothetical protein VCHA37P202_30033 [Vibrio chagasii]CAH7318710.1 hypothetical protein VCHA49P380_40032 [Vibrio chagasii]
MILLQRHDIFMQLVEFLHNFMSCNFTYEIFMLGDISFYKTWTRPLTH